MPRIDLASCHYVSTLFGVSCGDNFCGKHNRTWVFSSVPWHRHKKETKTRGSPTTIFYRVVSEPEFFSRGLSSSKRNHHLWNGGWLPGKPKPRDVSTCPVELFESRNYHWFLNWAFTLFSVDLGWSAWIIQLFSYTDILHFTYPYITWNCRDSLASSQNGFLSRDFSSL